MTDDIDLPEPTDEGDGDSPKNDPIPEDDPIP